jgi:hypothetical protein
LASGSSPGSGYQRVWFQEWVEPDEISFEPNVFLLSKSKVQALKTKPVETIEPDVKDASTSTAGLVSFGSDRLVTTTDEPEISSELTPTTQKRTFRLAGQVPSEVWNRLGTKLLTKLKTGEDLQISVEFSVTIKPELAAGFETEIRQVLQDLALLDKVQIQRD